MPTIGSFFHNDKNLQLQTVKFPRINRLPRITCEAVAGVVEW